MSSRWAALLAPAAFGAAFELGRIGAVGPTVDAIRLDGLLRHPRPGRRARVRRPGRRPAHGRRRVLGSGPRPPRRSARQPELADGAARPAGRSAFWRAARGTSLVLATVLVVGLGAALARPARTAPILDADGDPLPGQHRRAGRVPIGGHDQSIMLRGRDVEAPVLLFLEGGPGGTALGSMRYAGSRWRSTSRSRPGTSAAPASRPVPSSRWTPSPSPRRSPTRSR